MSSLTTPSISYDGGFFDYISIGSRRSAAIVAPLVLKHYQAKSVADIGCGRGAWLAEWQRAGVTDYIGIDGDYIDRDQLLISPGRFVTHDLTKRFDIGRRFDLVVSLEVGEHINPAIRRLSSITFAGMPTLSCFPPQFPGRAVSCTSMSKTMHFGGSASALEVIGCSISSVQISRPITKSNPGIVTTACSSHALMPSSA